MLKTNEVYHGDSLVILKDIDNCSIDSIVTDPPYGYSFMNKGWDKVLISVELWKECLRVLKPGSFAAIMSSPRQDILSRMIVNLQDAGFRTDFTSIYWAYASGFPKAANVSKLVDKRNGINRLDQGLAQYLRQKRLEKGYSLKDVDKWLNGKDIASHLESLCNSRNYLPRKHYYLILKEKLDLDNRFDELIEREEAEREIIGQNKTKDFEWHKGSMMSKETTNDYTTKTKSINITKSVTDKAKELDGSYAGFQPKPAVEVILMVMKPLSEKTFVDQALKNGKGVTWLDNCRIPFQDEKDIQGTRTGFEGFGYRHYCENAGYDKLVNGKDENLNQANSNGRFPANLLVSDDVLNDGKIYKSGTLEPYHNHDVSPSDSVYKLGIKKRIHENTFKGDSGSYSRYFDLDRWFETTFPFIITPKASSSEKNRGLDSYITVKLLKTEIDNDVLRCQRGLMAVVQLLERVTSDMGVVSFSIDESGENITALFPKDSLSIISTRINKIIESKILNLLTHSHISDYIQDVNLLMENGGNPVVNAEILRRLILTTIKGKTELVLGVSNAALKMLLKIKEKENYQNYKNSHATVKPIKLMSWLITLLTRENDIVLDPFLGSGTTAIAAKMLNRRWIGIEKEKDYVYISEARLLNSVHPL